MLSILCGCIYMNISLQARLPACEGDKELPTTDEWFRLWHICLFIRKNIRCISSASKIITIRQNTR
jgi:hypothetical protein